MYEVNIKGQAIDLEQVAAEYMKTNPDVKAVVFTEFGVWSDGKSVSEVSDGLFERFVANGILFAVLDAGTVRGEA